MKRNGLIAAIGLLCVIVLNIFGYAAHAATVGEYNPSNPIELDTSHLQCAAAVLIDGYTGKMLYGKNSKNRVYPASTTKIMTALLALEHGDLASYVTAGSEAAQIPGDSSRIPILEGEQITFKDLVYGTMIASGNDGANVIAVQVAGSVSAFVEMMNEKARELGCEDTNFKNAHGYTDNEHYTTPRDMAKITRAAMQNPVFRDIVSTTAYTIPASNKRDKPLELKTTNKFLMRDGGVANTYEYGIGVKTGFTSQAQHTFVGAAEKDGMMLIAAVFKSTKEGKWIDAARLMEYGFAEYRSLDVAELYERAPLSISVDNASLNDGSQLKLELDFENAPSKVLEMPGNIESIMESFTSYTSIKYSTETFVAPINQGDVLGELTLALPDGDIYTYPLIASRSISSGDEDGGYANAEDESHEGEPTSIDEIARRAAQSPLAHIGNWWWIVPTALFIVIGGWVALSFTQRRQRYDDMRKRRRRHKNFR